MLKVNHYLDYCRYMRHYSEETIKTYSYVFQKFDEVCKVEDEKITTQDVVSYLMQLGKEKLTPATINLHRAALMSYFRFTCQFYGRKENPVAIIAPLKEAPKLFGTISENEMLQILSKMPTSTDIEIRDKLILTILYHCGLRVSELVALNRNDMNEEQQVFTVFGKGRKKRVVPFSDEILNLINNKLYKIPYNGYIINNCSDGEQLTTIQIRYIVKKNLLPFVRKDKAHPHALRHAFATTLLNNGMGIESISKLMGHSSINTTVIYLSLSMDKISNLYHKIF